MKELIITNPEFNKMASELLETETCILLSPWEIDILIYEFYTLN